MEHAPLVSNVGGTLFTCATTLLHLNPPRQQSILFFRLVAYLGKATLGRLALSRVVVREIKQALIAVEVET